MLSPFDYCFFFSFFFYYANSGGHKKGKLLIRHRRGSASHEHTNITNLSNQMARFNYRHTRNTITLYFPYFPVRVVVNQPRMRFFHLFCGLLIVKTNNLHMRYLSINLEGGRVLSHFDCFFSLFLM